MRLFLHYCSAIVILGIYGGQVCPFLETLTPLQLILPIIVALATSLLVRRLILPHYITPAKYQQQSLRVFLLEFMLFVASGLFLMAFNRIVYDFPWSSGLKLVLAMTTLGFFLAIDMSLAKERELSALFWEKKFDLDPEKHYFPFPAKLAILAVSCSIFVCGIIFLVINKDLDWLGTVGKTIPVADAQRSILLEFVFVFGVLLAYILNLVISFAHNMRTYFHNENSVLIQATGGHLDGAVPVSTSDEFGVMAKHTNLMIVGLKEKTEELQRTRDVTIMSLASLAETRDNETGAHLLRTQRYIKSLANHLQDHPAFKEHLDEETIELLFKSAPLHDIGKVGIPDHILLKPGRLTPEEFTIMKTHASLGGDALRGAEKSLGSNSFLRLAREIAYCHHEKWDGSGYPLGLIGHNIPVPGRLMALADVYDALISARVYKPAFPHEKAKGIILEGRSSHFDPDVVDAFLAVEGEFIQIAKEYGDAGE